jgi:hypothetical protein
MTRESDEECLALIATIRERAGMPFPHEVNRLLGNLEARIAEIDAVEKHHADCKRTIGDLRAERDSLRSELAGAREKIERLREGECKAQAAREQARLVEEQGSVFGAIRFRDIIREEVAAEVARMLGLYGSPPSTGTAEIIREAVVIECERRSAKLLAFLEPAIAKALEAQDS